MTCNKVNIERKILSINLWGTKQITTEASVIGMMCSSADESCPL